MGATTGVGWTKHTFNAWIGCTEAGPGCDLCYARSLDVKYQWGLPKDVARANREAGVAGHWGPDTPRYRTSEGYWKGPLLWNKWAAAAGVPSKIFCNSLSDVFDNEVPPAWRDDLFDLWAATPHLRWQVVTKRIGNAHKMLKDELPPNVGLISTVVTQAEMKRDYLKLISIPATWHGFSMEPQLELIRVPPPLLKYESSLWFITGGESRQRAAAGRPPLPDPRPWNPMWAADLIGDIRERPNMKVFVKQTGALPVGYAAPKDGAGADPAKWPSWLRVQDFVPELLA